MGISPGNNFGFESAPFKLPNEYIELMDGKDSDLFDYFKNLLVRAFIATKKYIDEIVYIIKIMQETHYPLPY